MKYSLPEVCSQSSKSKFGQGDKNNGTICSAPSSESESLPYNRDWDILSLDDQEIIRKEHNKEEEDARRYSSFVDEQPFFCDDKRKLHMPTSLSGIDRVAVVSQMNEMREKENKALQAARLLRDECARLRQCVREKENEIEAVRYYWRNTVLESQTRSGRILKLALDKHS